MSAHWTPAQREKALIALCDGATQREAAKASGISEATLRRRLQEPEFQADLKERQQAQLAGARRVINQKSLHAAIFLGEVGSGQRSATSAQVQAGIAVLRFAGMEPPKQIEVAAGISRMSDEELEAQLLSAAGQLGGTAEDDEDGGEE